MGRGNRELHAIRQIVRQEMNRRNERNVFAIVFISGIIMLVIAAFVDVSYWQSLLLNLGSSLVVFVFLFWIFQYFTDRQPGSQEQVLPPELQGILDHDTYSSYSPNGKVSDSPPDRALPVKNSRHRSRAPKLDESDQANIKSS